MHVAVKLQVTIPKDRIVQLPDNLPEGQAEIIVLYAESAAEDERARREAAPSPAQAKQARYFERLMAHQPLPLSAKASRALDEADRGER